MKLNHLQIEKKRKNGVGQFVGKRLGKFKIPFYTSSQYRKSGKAQCNPFKNLKLMQNIASAKYHLYQTPCVRNCQNQNN